MMKKIGEKQILHIAKLAQLELKPSEVTRFSSQLSETLDYVEVLNEIDKNIKNLSPTAQVTKLENVFRKDEVKLSLSQKETLSNAKRTYKGFFVTKAIFE